nr:MarR family transcriptional regulator [Vibrio anguillarum]
DDRRSIVVTLTAEGQKIHRQHNQLHVELVKDLTRHLDANEETVLLNSLLKMNQEF